MNYRGTADISATGSLLSVVPESAATYSGTMWSLIGLVLLAMLGVAVVIVGTVLLVIFLVRMFARRQNGDA